MRTLLLLIVLLAAGFWLLQKLPRTSISSLSPAASSSSAPANAPQPRPSGAPQTSTTPAQAAEDWDEATYIKYGMPPLSDAWDAEALNKIAVALRNIGHNRPRALPSPDTAYGKAFFNQLRHTVKRFHLMSADKKVATYNAFANVIPAFNMGRSQARPRDKELALLTGLDFELLAGFTEDALYVKDPGSVPTRTITDLAGNQLTARSAHIYALGRTANIADDIERQLKFISDPAAFRPEARALALSLIAQHLPVLVRRLNLTTIRPLLEAHRAAEPDPNVRAYYDTLLSRLP